MKDLGTYFVKIVFEDGDGFIYEWNTGARFVGGGTETISPLESTHIKPSWENEDDLIRTIEYQFLEGNYSCDCNKRAFLDQAHQREDKDYECGDVLSIKEMTIITPDGREILSNLK